MVAEPTHPPGGAPDHTTNQASVTTEGGHGEHERRFRAMGTDCHVVVVGPAHLAEAAEAEVRRLEDRWSRFVDTSEVSRLNAARGAPVRVSADTLTLVRRATLAFETTSGWFDPFLGREIVAAGYDRDFDLLEGPEPERPRPVDAAPDAPTEGPPAPRRRDTPPVTIGFDTGTVQLADGVDFDPGGLGKGLGADLVSERLLEWGASGALVNLGGDLRCSGMAPADTWRIDIDDPLDRSRPPVATVELRGGGLCTSTARRRRWRTPSGATAHHLLDPSTGRPASTGPASVTVIAPEAWRAESLAKAVYLAGRHRSMPLLRYHQAGAVVVDLDGTVERL